MCSRLGREQRGGQGEFLFAPVGAPILSNLNYLLGSFNKVLAQPSWFDRSISTCSVVVFTQLLRSSGNAHAKFLRFMSLLRNNLQAKLRYRPLPLGLKEQAVS